VIVSPVGGGFGGKHGEEAVEAARLAGRVGRRVHWSRAEEFEQGHLRPMAVIDVRAGLDAAGSVTAWDFLTSTPGRTALLSLTRCPTAACATSRPTPCTHKALIARSPRPPTPSRVSRTSTSWRASQAPNRCASGSVTSMTSGLLPSSKPPPGGSDGHPAGSPPAVRPRRGGHWLWRGAGVAVGMEKGGRVATCAEVRADGAGHMSVVRIVTAYECRAAVNPDTVLSQIEGDTVMAIGGALFESVAFDYGQIASPSLSGYRVPHFTDVPELDVVLIDRPDLPSAGAGETPLIAVAPAIANAIFAATGRELSALA
jgi:isoquinoline 1-oxidoreductase